MIELLQISSNKMIADSLIKALKMVKFRKFHSLLGVCLETQAEIKFTDNKADNRTDNRANKELN